MAKRLFVGNLPFSTTEMQLRELFSKAGNIESVSVIIDRDTNRGKGFAFVEMVTEAEAQKAIEMFNGYQFEERPLVVNEARPQENRNGPPRSPKY